MHDARIAPLPASREDCQMIPRSAAIRRTPKLMRLGYPTAAISSLVARVAVRTSSGVIAPSLASSLRQ